MLERASSCVEPVSHLLLRRLEPPVRSRRILGPSFWRNGADERSVPHWWPLYLDNVRAKSRSRGRVDQGRKLVRPRYAAEQAKYCHTGSTPLRSDAPSNVCPPKSPSRAYTKPTRYDEKIPKPRHLNTNLAVIRADSAVEEHLKSFSESRRPDILSTYVNVSEHDASTDVVDNVGLRPSSQAGFESDPPDVTPGDTIDDTERKLRELLNIHESLESEAKTNKNIEAVWALFKQLPDQEAYAAEVFRVISRSTVHKDLKVALRAFKLIPRDKRRATDYERAARTAVQRNDYRQAISINAEATSRHLNQDCSTFLLLHTASHQLWNAAAQIWSMSFVSLTRNRQRLSISPIGRLMLKRIDKYQNLPLAVSSLAKEILDRRAVVMHQAGTLLHLGRELLYLVVKSGRLMSIIAPPLLASTLDHYRQLRLLNPTVHLDAINTLLKSARRPDRSKLAGLIYHHLRSNFPHFQPSPSLYGAIFSILSDEGAPSEVFMYWLRQFTHLHGAADKLSYQKALTALAAQGDIDGVQALFVELCSVHSRPTDVAYFTPLLYVYARLGNAEGAEREFQRLQDWGLEPTLYCWNILLYAYARSAEPVRAFDLFEKMKEEGVRPDVYTFGTLMGIVARSGDIDAVLEIIEQAQQYHIKGSYDMICGLVHSYCLNDQADIAERLAEATTKANFEGKPVKMWNYLLRHYAFQSDSEGVLRVQQSMISLRLKPDEMTYAALMAALVVIGKTRDAAQILNSLDDSSTLAATPFHYSIVLQGYAQEGNQEMADRAYKQMVKLFPQLTPSSRLAMLHLQGLRSLDTDAPPNHASDYLGTILHQLANQDRATKLPQPGFGRRKPVHALPSIYLEFMAGILASNGRTEQADKLLRRYETLSHASYLDLDQSAQESISLRTTRLIISTQQQDWEAVEKTWGQILDWAVRAASPYSARRRVHTADDETSNNLPASSYPATGKVHTAEDETSNPSPAPPEPTLGTDSIGGPNFSFSSMITNGSSLGLPSPESPLDRPGVKILFSQRYILEAPITRYLRALDIRSLHQTGVELVQKLERLGFSMTSKNWNFYVQMLTRSSDPKHWVLAFRTFEDKFLPNTPSWSHLRAGKWLLPSSAKSTTAGTLEISRRKVFERLNRGHFMPTYVTAVHLASVLLESNRRAARGDVSVNIDLWTSAPGTYRYIRRIPRSKDRIQGGVLRGRNILGNLQKRSRRHSHRQPQANETARQSPDPQLSSLADDEGSASRDVCVDWGLPRERRTKTKGKANSPPDQGALYNAHDRRLEKRAEFQRRLRDDRSAVFDDAIRHRRSGKFSPRKFGVLSTEVISAGQHGRRPRSLRNAAQSSRGGTGPEGSESCPGKEENDQEIGAKE